MNFLSEPLSFNDTVVAITEFIEVAIHSILYLRQVYPPDLFARRRKYATPVYQAQHPHIAQYITAALTSFGEELANSNVQRLIVVIKHAKTQVPYERFIFGMQRVVDVNEDNKDLGVLGGMSSESLTQYFRSFLVKLNMLESTLGDLPDLGDDASFAILMELKNKLPEPSADESESAPPWVPADVEYTTRGSSAAAQLHMVRAVDTGIINLALAVQESDAKLNTEKNKPVAPQNTQEPEASLTASNRDDTVLEEGSLEKLPTADPTVNDEEAISYSKQALVATENSPSVTGSEGQTASHDDVRQSSSSSSGKKRKSVSFQVDPVDHQHHTAISPSNNVGENRDSHAESEKPVQNKRVED